MEKFKKFSDFIKPEELNDAPRKPNRKLHWGYHLLLDMSLCNKNIDNENVVRAFLKELIRELKMTPIGDPLIAKVDGEDGRGLSAIQLITTSSITFHGDDEKMSVYLDIFSCKPYDPKQAMQTVIKYFNPKHIGHKFITRDAGDYPKK